MIRYPNVSISYSLIIIAITVSSDIIVRLLDIHYLNRKDILERKSQDRLLRVVTRGETDQGGTGLGSVIWWTLAKTWDLTGAAASPICYRFNTERGIDQHGRHKERRTNRIQPPIPRGRITGDVKRAEDNNGHGTTWINKHHPSFLWDYIRLGIKGRPKIG